MKKLLMLTAAIFALQAIPAIAEDGAKDGHKRGDFFEKVDTDKDGVISKAEFDASSKARADKKFAAMDKDGDGKVTKEEGKAHHEAMKAKWDQKKKERGDKQAGDVPPPAAE